MRHGERWQVTAGVKATAQALLGKERAAKPQARSRRSTYRRDGRDVAVGEERERLARVNDGLRSGDLEFHRVLLLRFARVRRNEICGR